MTNNGIGVVVERRLLDIMMIVLVLLSLLFQCFGFSVDTQPTNGHTFVILGGTG